MNVLNNIVVVDTDVVSFFFRRDSRAARYEVHVTGKLLVVSFMVAAELDRWALSRDWGPRRRIELERRIEGLIVRHSTRELCRMWAQVTDQARRHGRPIGVADAWHAATALLEGAPLITHNRDDYAGVADLEIISEAP